LLNNISLNTKLDSAPASQQLLNITQHIENGFQKNKITGAVFVDLTAAYDTVNHCQLLTKVLDMTKDPLLTKILEILLKNRRFFVKFNMKRVVYDCREMAYHREAFSLSSCIISMQMIRHKTNKL